MNNNKYFRIVVREEWAQHYRVFAKNKEEAKTKIKDESKDVEETMFECVDVEPKECWLVEEE